MTEISFRKPIRLGIVGIGKIARDQHLPSVAASPDFVMTAIASRHGVVNACPVFDSIGAMLAYGPMIDAVSICTPPEGRDKIARAAIAAGKHVMIEKPPGATVAEVAHLKHYAESKGVTLFASWHSREAAGVDAARTWLSNRIVTGATITWREDIRVWHPGQEWILGPGGFGVFDPGINALSIATAILPNDLVVKAGEIMIPENRFSPIAAHIAMQLSNGAPVVLDLDFLQEGSQRWDIEVRTTTGTLALTEGGKRLSVDGTAQSLEADAGEYPRLYNRFATLVREGGSDVDLRPLQLVADAFLVSRQMRGGAFNF